MHLSFARLQSGQLLAPGPAAAPAYLASQVTLSSILPHLNQLIKHAAEQQVRPRPVCRRCDRIQHPWGCPLSFFAPSWPVFEHAAGQQGRFTLPLAWPPLAPVTCMHRLGFVVLAGLLRLASCSPLRCQPPRSRFRAAVCRCVSLCPFVTVQDAVFSLMNCVTPGESGECCSDGLLCFSSLAPLCAVPTSLPRSLVLLTGSWLPTKGSGFRPTKCGGATCPPFPASHSSPDCSPWKR